MMDVELRDELRQLRQAFAELGRATVILFAALLVPVAVVFALMKLAGATDGPWWWILPYDAGTVVLIFFGAVGVVLYRRRRNRV
jgi:hypothetical protein